MKPRNKINYMYVDDFDENDKFTVDDLKFYDGFLGNGKIPNKNRKMILWVPKRSFIQCMKDLWENLTTGKKIYDIRLDRWREKWITKGMTSVESFKIREQKVRNVEFTSNHIIK